MSNQFEVFYNGHPVAITPLENDSFIAQITYKPVYLQLRSKEGREQWIDVETQQETFITAEIGRLIAAHLSAV